MTLRRLLGCGAFATAILLGLPPTTAQNLHDYVEAAGARNSELAALEARRDAIGARQKAAGSLTPGAPTFTASYTTDQLLRNRKQRDAQIGLSTPLWLPGEGTASLRVANNELARTSAQLAFAKLKLAGQVLDVLADYASAEAELAVAELRLRDGRMLEDDTGRRVKARDASDANLLLARAERISADSEVREKRSARELAGLEFVALTGLPPKASVLGEAAKADVPPAAKGNDAHPRLEDARGAVAVARANQQLANLQTRDSPEIGLIARRSRDMFGTVDNNSLGVEIKIPFSTEARNAPRQATAQAELKEATALQITAEREVAAERQKARIFYDNALVQRDLATGRAKALSQQAALIGRGQRGGEISFAEAVRARTLSYDADAAKARADIAVSKARGRLNQSLGMIP